MKYIIFLTIILSSCGAEQTALTNNEAVKAASDGAVECTLPILGSWTNDGDTSSLSIYNDNGVCKFSMSCGASGTIADLGQNNYELQDQTNSQACNFNSGFTINGKVKHISAMIYQGKLLTSINNESSNEWTKIN